MRAVVFDLDDTLYREHDYVLSGFRAVSRWAAGNLGVPPDHAYAELSGLLECGIRGNTFDLWLQQRGITAWSAADLVDVYRTHQPVLEPFPGIPELLEQLSGRVRIGLVSDGYHAVQQEKFRALRLANYFDAVVFSDRWGRDAWKPSPKPYNEVLRLLGVSPEHAVYVADNPAKDFIGAHRLGLSSVLCRYSGGDYCGRPAPSPDHRARMSVDTVEDLATHLMSMLAGAEAAAASSPERAPADAVETLG